MKCVIYTSAALVVGFLSSLSAEMTPDVDFLSYTNRPMGTMDKPLVLRCFVQNLGLSTNVTARHATGHSSPKYNPRDGLLSSSGSYKTMSAIPAAISVNLGKTVSYVWDTTECRLLYAWSGGFLDMTPHWGEPKRGRRTDGGYTGRLVGQLFYKAVGVDPLRINGKALPHKIRYAGHSRVEGHPVFRYEVGESVISVGIRPGPSPQTVELSYFSSRTSDVLTYIDPKTPTEVSPSKKGRMTVLLRPNSATQYTGFKKQVIKIDEPSAEIGEKLYTSFGCIACHTTDGGKNHGPSFKGLFGSTRDFKGAPRLVADEAYIRESITNPTAKTAPGYPEAMMPPYQIDSKQVDALLLYIQSLK